MINVFLGAICAYIGGGWIGAAIGAIGLGLAVFLVVWFYFALVFR